MKKEREKKDGKGPGGGCGFLLWRSAGVAGMCVTGTRVPGSA